MPPERWGGVGWVRRCLVSQRLQPLGGNRPQLGCRPPRTDLRWPLARNISDLPAWRNPPRPPSPALAAARGGQLACSLVKGP